MCPVFIKNWALSSERRGFDCLCCTPFIKRCDPCFKKFACHPLAWKPQFDPFKKLQNISATKTSYPLSSLP